MEKIYLEFVETVPENKVFKILSNEDKRLVGYIGLRENKSGYFFSPENNKVFPVECLIEIIKFTKKLMGKKV